MTGAINTYLKLYLTKKAIKLWNRHKIGTISQLTVCTEGMLKKILVISPELASAISALPPKD